MEWTEKLNPYISLELTPGPDVTDAVVKKVSPGRHTGQSSYVALFGDSCMPLDSHMTLQAQHYYNILYTYHTPSCMVLVMAGYVISPREG